MRSEFFYQLNNSAYRSCEQHQIAPVTSGNGIADRSINRTKFTRFCQNLFAIAANDPAAEPMFLYGKAERAANQAGADDGDLMKHRVIW